MSIGKMAVGENVTRPPIFCGFYSRFSFVLVLALVVTGESGESDSICSNESSESSSRRLSSAVCKADVILVEISRMISFLSFDSDGVRFFAERLKFWLIADTVGFGIGDNVGKEDSNGTGTSAVCWCSVAVVSTFNVLCNDSDGFLFNGTLE